MNNGLLQILVEEDFGYVKEGKSWGRSDQHSSLVVNEEEQKWYWNSEQMGGGVLEYLIKVRRYSKKDAIRIADERGKFLSGIVHETQETAKTGKPYEKLVESFWSLGKRHRDYWYARKLTDKTIDRYRLGYFDGWNTIPLYVGDKFVNFQCRRDIPEKRIKMWYKIPGWKPVMVNPEILQLVDTVFITEGPVDAFLLNQEGIPAVSHTGGAGYWNPEWIVYFPNTKKIYYIVDNDAAGIAAGKRVANSLGLYRTFLYRFEDKKEKYDTGDFFKEGGTGKEFKQLIETESKNLFEIGETDENRLRFRRRSISLAL